MRLLLELFGLMVLLWGVTGVAGMWWLRRRNRVAPGAASVPLLWLISPSRSACAHRRLRRAVRTCRQLTASPALSGAARDDANRLIAHAVALDARLLRWDRAHRLARLGAWSALRAEVQRFDTAVALLSADALMVDEARRPLVDPVGEVTERVTALRAARAEVAALDDPAGAAAQRQRLGVRLRV